VPSDTNFFDLFLNALSERTEEYGLINDDERSALLRSCRPPDSHLKDNYLWQTGIAKYINLISHKPHKKLFLAFDNLDYLYHKYDRGLFAKELGEPHKKALEFITNLVGMFLTGRSSPLGSLGINILFVIRHDTCLFMERKFGELPYDETLQAHGHIFLLEAPPLEEVIKTREKLLKYSIETIRIDKKKENYSQFEIKLNALISGRSKLAKAVISTLEGLSKQGHRAVMDHLAAYSYIEINTAAAENRAEISTRFLQQYYPTLLAFILGGLQRYWQFGSDLSNIYLVDAMAYGKEIGVPESLKKPYPHSYWLKRLISAYIHFKNNGVKPQKIYDVFCAGPDGYSSDLVRLALGSLSQVSSSYILDLDMLPSPGGSGLDVQSISLSTRGKNMLLPSEKLEREPLAIVDSFLYLQLIVDDWQLPLPSSIIDEEFNYTKELHYGYLCQPLDIYGEMVKQTIQSKARRVFIFLEILDVWLTIEHWQHKTVFDRLQPMFKNEIVPTVDNIKHTVEETLLGLKERLNMNLLDVKGTRKTVETEIRSKIIKSSHLAKLSDEERSQILLNYGRRK
jgi:hypothetical protein